MGLGVGWSSRTSSGTSAPVPVPGAARVEAASRSSSKEGAMRSAKRVVSPSRMRRLAPKVSLESTSSIRPSSIPSAWARRFSTKTSP